MNFVKSLNVFGTAVQQIPVIILHGAPTTSTEGAVGCFGMDVDSRSYDVYKCVAAENGVYTWESLGVTEDRVNELIVEALANIPNAEDLSI